MSSQPEARLQARIVRDLTRAGHFAMRQRLHGQAGYPDLYGITLDGRPFHLEVKRPGGKPTRAQVVWLERLSEAGAIIGVVHDSDEALALLRGDDA